MHVMSLSIYSRGVEIGNSLIHGDLSAFAKPYSFWDTILASTKLRWQLVCSKRLFPSLYRTRTSSLLCLPILLVP